MSAIRRFSCPLNTLSSCIDSASRANHRTVNRFRTPDKVGAVVESEEARGQFARADHGCQDYFVAIVDTVLGDGHMWCRTRTL